MIDRRSVLLGGATALISSTLGARVSRAASDAPSLRVAVLGATGRTGSFVVSQLVERGHHVVGVSRRAKEQDARDNVTWMNADVTDLSSLRAALENVDAVIYAVGVNFQEVPERVLYDVYHNGVANASSVAKQAGAMRFVLLASAGKPEGHYRASYDAKFKGEDALRAAGLNYSISRTWGLWDKPGGQHAILLSQSDPLPLGGPFMITREDSASVLVECAITGHAKNATFTIMNAISYDNNLWRSALPTLVADSV